MWKYKSTVLALLCIGIYIVIASYSLRLPGPHYDEVFYTNAALGPIDNDFVHFKIGNFPIMIMDYIGALKAWVYGPIFKIFGVSTFSIRFPNIVITAVGLWFLFLIIKRVFNIKIALLSLFLLSMDPSFIIHTRLDFGPVVLGFFIRVMSILSFYAFMEDKKWKDLFIYLGLLGIGIFNKLDFVWYATAICISGAVMYRTDLYFFWKKQSLKVKKISLLVVSLLFITGLTFFWKTKYYETIDFFYLKHFMNLLKDAFQFINGTLFYEKHLGTVDLKLSTLFSVFMVSIMSMRFFTLFLKKSKTKTNILFFYLICFFIFGQIIITNKAGASWHIFMLYPFIPVLFADALIWISEKSKKKSKAILSALIVFIVFYNVYIIKLHIQSYANPKSIHWSPAIYDLIRYTQNTDAQFISVDWGIHNQLQAFDHIKGKYYDVWTTFIKDPNDRETKQFLVRDFYRSNKSTFFILNTETFASFQQPRKTLFRIAKENNISLIKTREFTHKGRVIYELYTPLSN